MEYEKFMECKTQLDELVQRVQELPISEDPSQVNCHPVVIIGSALENSMNLWTSEKINSGNTVKFITDVGRPGFSVLFELPWRWDESMTENSSWPQVASF